MRTMVDMDGFPNQASLPARLPARLAGTALHQSPAHQSPAASFLLSRLWCAKEHVRGSCCSYRINWSINPHMRVGDKVDLYAATAQHRYFAQCLVAAGGEVTLLPFVHGAYDSVFAKDNALLIERDGRRWALLAAPRFGERAREQTDRAQAFMDLGFAVHDPPSSYLEGGDVVMLPRGAGALLGYGQRSARESAAALSRFIAGPVTALELTDPALFHLDMALSVLSDGTALVCAEVLTPAARQALGNVVGITSMIEVPRLEALSFGLNLVEVGATILVGGDAPYTESVLRALGWRVVVIPLAQFHLAGGSAACLTARIHRCDPDRVSVQRSPTRLPGPVRTKGN